MKTFWSSGLQGIDGVFREFKGSFWMVRASIRIPFFPISTMYFAR